MRMETLKVNGVEKQFPAGQLPATIAELLRQFGINEAAVVAEVDGRVVARKQFAQTRLYAGQSIELVRFMGGG
jgi:thiamine biosynthesis protein ThiS